MFPMKDVHHFSFFDDEQSSWCNRGGRSHAQRLTCEAPFSEEVTGAQNRDHGFFPDPVDNRKLHAALLNVHNGLGGITLRENRSFLAKLDNLPRHSGRIKESLNIKRSLVIHLKTSRNRIRLSGCI